MPLSARDLELRRGRMSATGIVKVAGLSPYGNAHDVFADMVEGRTFQGNESTRRGERLEPVILDWAGERIGRSYYRPGTIIHPTHERICATPDAIADEKTQDLVIEAKSLDFARVDECGEDGSDKIPHDWFAQVQVQMGVTGIRRANVAVMFGVSELRIYPVEYDADAFEMLAEIAERFLRDHIDTKRPPAIDASEGCTEALRARFPKNERPVIQATPDAEQWAFKLFEARQQLEGWENREREARNHLQALIGDADGMRGEGWSISYKRQKDSLRTDWEALAKAYTPTPAELAKHTTTKPGPRVFRVTGPKEK